MARLAYSKSKRDEMLRNLIISAIVVILILLVIFLGKYMEIAGYVINSIATAKTEALPSITGNLSGINMDQTPAAKLSEFTASSLKRYLT